MYEQAKRAKVPIYTTQIKQETTKSVISHDLNRPHILYAIGAQKKRTSCLSFVERRYKAMTQE